MAIATRRMTQSRCLAIFTLFVLFELSQESDSKSTQQKSLRFESERLKFKDESRTFVIDSELFRSENGNSEFDSSKSVSAGVKLRTKRDATSSKSNTPSAVSVSMHDFTDELWDTWRLLYMHVMQLGFV